MSLERIPQEIPIQEAIKSSETFLQSAAEIENVIIEPEKLSGKAKAVAMAMAMLTQAACVSIETVSMSRTSDLDGRLESPEAYCERIDSRINYPGNHRYEKTIETRGGTAVLRGIKTSDGKNMTVEIIRPDGTRQRIDCK